MFTLFSITRLKPPASNWLASAVKMTYFEECHGLQVWQLYRLKKRYCGRYFWARGYFCVTVGQMTEEMIKQYLEHHFEPNPNDEFKMEPP